MGKKKSQNNEGEKKIEEEPKNNKKNEDGGKKKDSGSITVTLKVDLHCDGCASKVIKSIRSFEGVESVKRNDDDKNKLTVIGNVDPVKLRENVEQKTKKQVVLISPLPKKDKGNENQKDTNDGDGAGKKNKKNEDSKEEKKSKEKEPPVTTTVLKVNLHCEGCIQKIYKIVTKTKGYHEITFDRQKNLVTVKGSMEMKALAESLKKKLKKDVEIVPPPKKEGGGEKKEKGNGGGGGNDKGKDGGGGKAVVEGSGDGGDMVVVEGNKLQYGYPYPYPYVHEPVYMSNAHAPQMFSDENPNACSVM